MSVTVKYDRRAYNTEAFALLAEGWNELVQGGLTSDFVGSPPFGPDSEVIYAVGPDGDVVGAIVFEEDLARERIVVKLAYVEPTSRKRGTFRAMMESLKARAYTRPRTGTIYVELPKAGAGAHSAFQHLGAEHTASIFELRVS